MSFPTEGSFLFRSLLIHEYDYSGWIYVEYIGQVFIYCVSPVFIKHIGLFFDLFFDYIGRIFIEYIGKIFLCILRVYSLTKRSGRNIL